MSGDRLFAFTVTSPQNDSSNLNDILRTSRRVGIDLHVVEVSYDFRSMADKSRECLKVISELHPDTITLFVDGYDSFFVKGADVILDRYMRHWRGRGMVFGASQKCYPNVSHGPRFPLVQGSFRYLNSGLHIGRAQDCMEPFQKLFQLADGYHFFDQEIWCQMYVDGISNVFLDTQCAIFQNCHENPDGYICQNDNELVNLETGTTPCIFHCPGKISWDIVRTMVDNQEGFRRI